MTDQTIPDVTDGERRLARKWAEDIKSDMDTWGDSIRAVARVILNAVPAPPRPTLADMTDEERRACRRLQCDVHNAPSGVIAWLHSDRCVVLYEHSPAAEYALERVTPRPDLPRLEWPGDTPAPVPALPDGWRLADHQKHGRVIVTNPTPNRDGRVYFVLPADDPMGYDWFFCPAAELTYLDQKADQ